MTAQALMDAVKASIQGYWPKDPVYTNYIPKDFKRPSFALELQKDDWTDGNLFLIQRSVSLLLSGYVETNAYGDSAREALNQRMESACELFARGWIQVEDRAVHVRTVRGLGAPDFFEITLIFSWLDGRPGSDPDDGSAPLMEHFVLNISTEKE